MKPIKRKEAPDPALLRATELSLEFAKAGWRPSTQNFAERPFVQWHGSFFSACGFPEGDTCHSTCVKTDAEVLAWLESFKAKPEPVDADLTAVADLQFEAAPLPTPPTDKDQVQGLGYPDEGESPDPRDEELEREDATPLPPNPTETKLSDYGNVGEEGIPPDLAQLMMDNEPLPEAVARLTPSIDELLDMAQVLSDASMEHAIGSFPKDRFEEWTEKLWAEKARLRTKRGTDEENLSRENLISRVAGLFMRVGAKR